MLHAAQPLAPQNISAAIPYPPRAAAWYATIVFAFLYWLSILDRFIISLLVDPIKKDLGLSDLQFGLLHGFAFAGAFALFGLLAGLLADRFSRRWIIFFSVSTWSLATSLCGVAQNFWHLFLSRLGVGAGEAGLNPCATSMLADLFPRERLTSAMAVYAMGATVGGGCALIFGGSIVHLVSQHETLTVPVLGTIRSWQAVFFIVGLPGLLLSLLVFTLPEPARRDRSTKIGPKTANWWGAYATLLKFMGSRRRFFVCHYVGFAFASLAFTGGVAWYPVHLGRSFSWDPAQVGLTLGLALVIASVVGQLLCGRLVDRMYRRGRRDAQLRWYAGCLLVSTPIGVLALTSADPWFFVVGIGVFLLLLTPLPACYTTALHLVTPNELRGAGIGFFAATAGLIGSGTGPVAVAAASQFFEGPSAIGMGMATVIGICCPLAAVALALGFKAMSEAVVAAETRIGG